MGRVWGVEVFVVERYLVGWTADDIRGVAARLNEIDDLLATYGVRYLKSVMLTADETCLCIFEGPNELSVRAANGAAGLPVDRVVLGEVLPI
jgi:Protein of unknown function (DUF4242)